MSKLGLELQSLSPSAIIELYVLDMTPDEPGSTNKYYFHSGTNKLSNNIVWQGVTYVAMPIEVTGYETTMVGQLPRLKVAVANVNQVVTALILNFDDALGAKLTRKMTFAKFLDAVNFPGGVNAAADATVYLPDEDFYCQRKVTENKSVVEFEFATRFETDGVMLPRRQVTANLCTHQFRGAGCRYAGMPKMGMSGEALLTTPQGTASFAPWDDAVQYHVGDCFYYVYPENVYLCHVQPPIGTPPTNTTYWQRTGCPKSIAACKTHFGATAALPFGAFPGVAKLIT